jgi:hypothetical protein
MSNNYTPDPVAVLSAQVAAVAADVAQLKTDVTALKTEAAAGPGVAVPPPVAHDPGAEFLAKWKPPTDEEKAAFFKRYPDAAAGKVIPQMTEPNEAEATLRARFGYSWQGGSTGMSFPAKAKMVWDAIGKIAAALSDQSKAEALWELGRGTLFPDFAAFALLSNLFDPQPIAAQHLGAARDPASYAGQTIQGFLDAQFQLLNAKPSGG